MMKKGTILLLCLLYTFSVYGVAFNVNYCFGEVQSVKIGAASNVCPMCHSIVKMKCCKTKHVEVKVKDAHLAGADSPLVKAITFIVPQVNYQACTPVWQQAHVERILYHAQNAPPPDKDLILIKNRSFRI